MGALGDRCCWVCRSYWGLTLGSLFGSLFASFAALVSADAFDCTYHRPTTFCSTSSWCACSSRQRC